MPGAHLELKLMQCYPDVGGTVAWLSGFWDGGSQWWTGWHLPGPAMQWSWPNPDWRLIGFERWQHFKRYPHHRLMEGMYQEPNPSMQAEWQAGDLIPVGHWHVTYHSNGQQLSATWDPNPLEEPRNLYLKGRDHGKGKGKGPADEGKGKGSADKGKGKGKDKNKGKP